MRLFLLRHAEASYDAPTDEARELTPRGEQSVARLCRHLKAKPFAGLPFIVHSGLVRARQTAELFRDELSLDVPLRVWSGLTPEDDPCALAERLWASEEDLMLVGHNPHLTLLAAWLLTGDANTDCVHFKKCALMGLERGSRPRAGRSGGTWALAWHLCNQPLDG